MLRPKTMMTFILKIPMVCIHIYLNQTTEGNVLIRGRQTQMGVGGVFQSKNTLYDTFDLRKR